jgi:hypothetical protein
LTRVCADVLAQVDGAGTGGRGRCRRAGLVQVGGADALECCCANATRVNAADANAGFDASKYALAREGPALTIVRGL